MIISSPAPSYESLVSVKENIDRKIKKKERKKKMRIEHKPN